MKRRNLISALVLFHHQLLLYGTKAQGTSAAGQKNPLFECPIECPPGVYRPICSRGISYVNLCILKQQICQGNAALEIYKDVEACPKYDKDEDATGASIEAIDKNGVIFRTLMDSPRARNASEKSLPTSSSPADKKEKSDNRAAKQGEKGEESARSICVKRTNCSIHEIDNPVCILGIELSSFCTVKRLVCESYLPTAAISLVESCKNSQLAVK